MTGLGLGGLLDRIPSQLYLEEFDLMLLDYVWRQARGGEEFSKELWVAGKDGQGISIPELVDGDSRFGLKAMLHGFGVYASKDSGLRLSVIGCYLFSGNELLDSLEAAYEVPRVVGEVVRDSSRRFGVPVSQIDFTPELVSRFCMWHYLGRLEGLLQDAAQLVRYERAA